MQYPTKSPIDPTDLPPEPVGEVPPVMVAVPSPARVVLNEAGLAPAIAEGLLRARVEELDAALADIQRTVNEACTNLQMALRGSLPVRFDAGTEREGCGE